MWVCVSSPAWHLLAVCDVMVTRKERRTAWMHGIFVSLSSFYSSYICFYVFVKFVIIQAERSWTFREQGQHQRQARVDSLTQYRDISSRLLQTKHRVLVLFVSNYYNTVLYIALFVICLFFFKIFGCIFPFNENQLAEYWGCGNPVETTDCPRVGAFKCHTVLRSQTVLSKSQEDKQ